MYKNFKLATLLLSLFFQDFWYRNSVAAVWMPDCSKEKHKKKPQCVCKNPANWHMKICEDWWNAPDIKANVDNMTKIVGGELAPRDAYPWFARLIERNGKWWGCGGMLIAKKYVLTAAHCVRNNEASSLAVQIGAVCPTTTNNNCGQPIQTINVESVQRHSNYNNNNMSNDFALLKLSGEANAEPVPIDQGNVVVNYSSNKRGLYAIGFGSLSTGGAVAEELRRVELAFVPRSTCDNDYNGAITNVMMCATDPGQDSCQGDSGGPLYDEASNALVGVVSWGYDCADPDYPGVYAQVSTAFNWIKSKTCDSNPKPDYCDNVAPTPTAPTPTAPTPTAPTPTAPTPTSPTPTSPTLSTSPCGNSRKKRFALTITTDFYGGETSFKVYMRRNGKFKKRIFGRNFLPSERTKQFSKCLPKNGCYKLVVSDSHGDGMCCDFGNGSFQGYWDGTAVPNVDNVFDNGFDSESQTFGNC